MKLNYLSTPSRPRRPRNSSNKVNVSDIARKVLGIKNDVQVKDMSPELRRDFWCISKMFGKVTKAYTGVNRRRTNGGRGMELVQNYILQH